MYIRKSILNQTPAPGSLHILIVDNFIPYGQMRLMNGVIPEYTSQNEYVCVGV